jgi:solute carrier family 25 folate transporter 32
MEKINNNSKPSYLVSLISGASAGILTTTLFSPLDVAKTRLQVQGSLGLTKYKGGTLSVLKIILKDEGVGGFFKGLGPALCTVPLFWGIYWCAYDQFKDIFGKSFPESSSHINHLCSAILAGTVGDIVSNPFWVIRTRIQTQMLHSTDNIYLETPSTMQTFRTIYNKEGPFAFFRGLSASLLGLSHVAIQFPLYEYFKIEAKNYNNGTESYLNVIFASTGSKLIASFISYPHEVLRARLQDNRNSAKPNIFRLTEDIIRKEGLHSLWSGFRINIVKVLPASATTFLCYEYLSKYLNKYSSIL